jgi:hypothetical protein
VRIRIGQGSHHGCARPWVAGESHGKRVVAHKGDAFAVRGELGVVAGGRSGKADLDPGAVAQIVEPEPPVGVEQRCAESGAQR